ncbi:MAG: hypothetical protein AB2L14_12765 [Candidatus Xenobiia bacterium LiM19]
MQRPTVRQSLIAVLMSVEVTPRPMVAIISVKVSGTRTLIKGSAVIAAPPEG